MKVNGRIPNDGHAISFHESDPNLDSAGVELEKAKLVLEELHELFPNLLVCDSNHGSLVYRRAKAHGLPVQFIKKYRDILFPEHGAPSWSWADAWVLSTPLGPVRFQHQVSGDFMLNASHERTSLVSKCNTQLLPRLTARAWPFLTAGSPARNQSWV